MTDERMESYRQEIDEVDQELISVLARRFEISKKIGTHKRRTADNIVQRDRATVVRNNYVRWGKASGLSLPFMEELYQMIHSESCRVQQSSNVDDVTDNSGM